MNLKELYHNNKVRFCFWALLYILWVIWLGNYWWLTGLVVIFDMTLSRKVNWTFWKPRDVRKRNALTEWVDAIIFAVIVVTFLNVFFVQSFKIPSSSMESSLMTGDRLFVSKLSYGPRMPQTPLTIPFTHNVIFGKNSYSTLIQNDYRRLKGFGRVKRYDPVVFGFPNGDTVLIQAPAEDYYMLSRMFGRDKVISEYGPVLARPEDKVDHYVKRCVGIPGDNLQIENGVLYVNGEKAPEFPGEQSSYRVVTSGSRINSRILEKEGINEAEAWFAQDLPGYPALNLTRTQADRISRLANVVFFEANVDVYPPDYPDSPQMLFPHSENFRWTRDNYGPLKVPAKGDSVALTVANLPLYSRIISHFEHHALGVDGERIIIDGVPADSYVFGSDYYFMMGDNRHNSLDSRYWGFVPESYVVGKPAIVWLSTDSSKSFPKNIRWSRFFKTSFSN